MNANAVVNKAETDALAVILGSQPPPFALVHRTAADGTDGVDVLLGEVSFPATLADIPLPDPAVRTGPVEQALVVVPYRQIAERGFSCVDDGSPLIAMAITEQQRLSLAETLDRVADRPLRLGAGEFDLSDDSYAGIVSQILREEIGTGAGANFVLKRSFTADISDYSLASALALFRRLLVRESGAYWTFIVHTGEHTFVGATPERHISLAGGTAVMNPISGTYRYPPSGPTLPEVMDFLADAKEADELYMVVDEELKMMARICDTGCRVVGPYLKEMARLAHTEYFIEGRTTRDPRHILRETLFAPTVTGSPLESASRVIERYEPHGRGYYSGLIALIGQDQVGEPTLDSAILIRTADIDQAGRLTIGVGATLVRHSDPDSEVAETHAKAAGLLAAFEQAETGSFRQHPQVIAALASRNTGISDFWLTEQADRGRLDPRLADRSVLVVDAEDTFTSMIGQQLGSLGLRVTVRRFDEPYDLDSHDLVVLGPGPGDPSDIGDRRIGHMHSLVATMLGRRQPFLAVCLSHQVLSLALGVQVRRLDFPNQGVQRQIDLFGVPESVGFYNAFAARSDHDSIDLPDLGTVEVSRDRATGEVYALRGSHFASLQFHAESVLTQDGPRILGGLLRDVLLRVPAAR
ncbi:MAG: anthranilate synthase family protein [Actinomycetota bacterium]|nr:anthranilate synthase family protein [Actinomycetota bacterium]